MTKTVRDLGTMLLDLARNCAAIDASTTQHLTAVGNAFVNENFVDWLHVDIDRVIDLDKFQERAEKGFFRFREGLKWVKIARNLLTLLFIPLNWLGLGSAVINYHAVLGASSASNTIPFLLLWERGFDGREVIRLPFLFTFSHLIIWDTVFLVVLILLVVCMYGWYIFEAPRAHHKAVALRLETERALGQMRLFLSREYYRRTVQNNEQFGESASGLLNYLADATAKADNLVRRREQEVAQMATVAEHLEVGVSDLPEFARQIRDIHQSFDDALKRFFARVDTIAQQQVSLEDALSETNVKLRSMSDRFVEDSSVVADRLVEVSDKLACIEKSMTVVMHLSGQVAADYDERVAKEQDVVSSLVEVSSIMQQISAQLIQNREAMGELIEPVV